ncbi:mannose-1-phosphate guanyltransferase [Geranomyces variabilis]|nr:mannose-1-phosphate guanyltransferase [Geranomyces variabilis]
MKALILVGGFGTRLRPLTFSKPKPLVDFANQPMILHQIEALAKVGVTDIVLAVNYQPRTMVDAMQEVEAKFNVKIHFSIESEPLGTAGPIALAKGILAKDDSPFFVLNSDVICDFPLLDMAAIHKEHGGEATILVTKVADPSKYGVVVNKEGSSQVERFVEKPTVFVSDKINAGIYILSTSVLDRIKPVPSSIEKEIFPAIASEGLLHTFDLPGFWMDVGQPKDYLIGTGLYLESLRQKAPTTLHSSDEIVGNVLVAPSAKIGSKCKIGPNVVLGPNVVIGDGVRLSNAVVMEGCTIGDNVLISDSIIGWHSTVGKWARLENVSVLGEDVHIAAEVFANGACVLPHKSIAASILAPKIVM